MQSVDVKGLKELDRKFAEIVRKAPEGRRKFHEKMADVLKGDIDDAIMYSGINDSEGKIRRWQVARVGNRGGYAAISPTSEGPTGANSPGAITNYLESGHNIRTPGVRSENYRPRLKIDRVSGYYFYETTSASIESRALECAEDWIDDMMKELEG